ncbi:RraA family protein [Phytohabitans flavus]|uniref:RraA family protein n=1 Tax=Phytohabitans flavus TaxID=1076124 RepID=UPI00363FA8CE
MAGVVAGRVRTVRAGAKQATGPAGHIAASVVDSTVAGDVIVIANDGRTDVSCWGGILTTAALRHGVAGVVVDGACRDIGESAAAGLPVFGRAAVPVSARGRIVQVAAAEPVDIAGVTVHEGDWVIADANGVVFVPAAHTGAVLDLAERIVAREARMVAAVQAGGAVATVMHDDKFPTAVPE